MIIAAYCSATVLSSKSGFSKPMEKVFTGSSEISTAMDDTKAELKDQPTETIAIIAALNIAYDLSVEKNKFREFSIQATDKIKKLKLLLDGSEIESVPS